MAGVTSVLDIAKEALLAHQLSVQVAAHNVANVDTPGYSRQTLDLTNRNPTPTAVGQIGNGVQVESILRKYDQVLVQRIIDQSSVLGENEAQQETLRVIEAIFNEAQGLGLNDLMSEFWQGWQDLVNNPENNTTRQTVIQKGEIITNHLNMIYSEILSTRFDIGAHLDSGVTDINGLSERIAKLNGEIATLEGPGKQANDLRDQRDELVKELAEFLDITYFENETTGAYSILLPDGHPLVESKDSNRVEWGGNQLYWLGTDEGIRTALGEGEDLGGRMGGWSALYNELVEDNPDNFLGRLNSFTNSLIREINQQHAQGVGMVSFSDSLTGSETANNMAVLTTTVDAGSALEDIRAGLFEINDREVGVINGVMAVNGIAMGKTYNAVTAVNDALNSVSAYMTTLTAGGAVTGLAGGDVVDFTVNGIQVTYAAAGAETANATATNVVAAINTAIAAYNADPATPIDMSLEAVVGDGTNGGAVDSIILRNTNAGDESRIVIAGIDPADPAEVNLALADGTYVADDTHNTGEITLVSDTQFEVQAGPDDAYLAQLGMDGGLHASDVPGDGTFTYSFEDPGGVRAALFGLDYFDELATDGGSFDLWVYYDDGIPVQPRPLTVNLDRAYTLQDVADAINVSITNASGGPAWLTAGLDNNRLQLRPAIGYDFAFGGDSSNVLQAAGVNTFFTGSDTATIDINQVLMNDVRHLAAGTVEADGKILAGDNTNVMQISDVQHDEEVEFAGGNRNSLDGYYNNLVGEIGSWMRSAKRSVEFNTMLSNQLQNMRDSVAGVSLDEELANLIKYQHAYSAAAKLISTADEMLLTLMNTLNR